MRLAFEKDREISSVDYLLSSPYSENTEQIKTEIIELLNAVTIHVTDLLNDSSSQKKKNILKDFFYPYKEDFKTIDAYTEKIKVGKSILSDKLTVKQYREDNEYEMIHKRLTILENQLIPDLERKQIQKKRKNNFILIMVFISHIIFYGWLFLK